MNREWLLRRRLHALAGDVGSLRRRLDVESYDGFLAARIAVHVETIDILTRPTAAQIFRANMAFGADEAEAIFLALAEVEEGSEQLHALLGREEARA